MSYFDVARLVVPHSGPNNRSHRSDSNSLQSKHLGTEPGGLKPAALFLHAHPSAGLHRRCSVYFPKNQACPQQEGDIMCCQQCV